MASGQDQSRPRLLNLGCGAWRHPDWTNVDAVAHGADVIACDLARGVPFADESFDAVYHSHLLEHFTRPAAENLLCECRRVLAPGGILRVAVPDLEQIARQYLIWLQKALRGEPGADARHDWMVHEFFEQMTRTEPGGDFARDIAGNLPEARDFILARAGLEALGTIAALDADPRAASRLLATRQTEESEQSDASVAAFRRSGEIHRWMYDRYSLRRLLARAGFTDVSVKTASESDIPGFAAYHLDALPNGMVRKPDSLFMEGKKPG